MATAYTSLLGLALPVTGELSGAWGDTVNQSITSLLDSAVSGTTTLSTDADVTLTTTDGVANQARQAIILWNPASGTVTRNITAPAQSKIYTVINASGGTQSIVFRGAGPTTGVTIIKGESAVVAWNGADFIKISNTGGGGSFTNVTISGTTTLSGLTASTALALNASKEVVSVTNTGTGNNVLSASPTLTGTISGANASLSGTLGVTGVATLTAQPILSSLTASQAVFTDGSKGLVSNAITGTGNVVMSTSPTLVTPALGTPSSVTLTNATGLPVATGISGFGTGVATALATNVGSAGAPVINGGALGTPSSGTVTNLTGTASININGTVGATTPSTGAFTTLSATGVTTVQAGTAAAPAITTSGDTNTGLFFPAADAVATTVGGTEQMRLTSTGLGIGTSSPAQKLTVVNNAGIVGANSDTLTSGAYLYLRGDSGLGGGQGTIAQINASYGLDLWGYNGGWQKNLTLTSSGNLGLGVTPSAWGSGFKALQIRAAGLADNNFGDTYLTANAYYNGTNWAYYQSTEAPAMLSLENGAFKFNTAAGGTAGNAISFSQVMTLDASGNLGIGTSSPLSRLTIEQGGDVFTSGFTLSRSGADRGTIFLNASNNTLNFGRSTATSMTLDSSGNLGLGVPPSAWSQGRAMEILESGYGNWAGSGGSIYTVANVYFNSGFKYANTGRQASHYYQFQGAHVWSTAPSGTAGNAISFSQSMTLDASGNLLVGTTTTSADIAGFRVFSTGRINASDSTVPGIFARLASDGECVRFQRDGTDVGSVDVTTTATTYNTSSDYRLKNITGPITTSGAYIDSLNPVEGTWKADGSTFVGLIAHEVQEASRTQVATGVKDGEEMQGMDYSSAEIIANLIAEVKALRTRVAALESI